MLDLLFEPDIRSYDRGLFEYDACVNGVYVLSHLDGDLARLVRFRLAAIEDAEHRYEAVCYPWQLEYAKPFLGERIELKLIDPARIAAALQGR